jgi:hypothetical protein
VGQHHHLATTGGCLLQEVAGSQIPDAPVVSEVSVQHVLSIADHSEGDNELSVPVTNPPGDSGQPLPSAPCHSAGSFSKPFHQQKSSNLLDHVICLLGTSSVPGAGGVA